MHIITGATGNVGATVVDLLLHKNYPVRGITRQSSKAAILRKKGAEAAIADAKDAAAFQAACEGGQVLFAITPETFREQDVLGETKHILQNYRQAVEANGIKQVVGLSSIGAQYSEGTGNLLMSHLLEHAFDGLPVSKVFIRPSYYFSNWLMYLPVIKAQGILPTFFPPEMRIGMMSPQDVAEIVVEVLTGEPADVGNMDDPGQDHQLPDAEGSERMIYELEGPQSYSSIDVAQAFSAALRKEVTVQQIPREKWEETLQQQEFSADAVLNFVEMTEAVVSGRTQPEGAARKAGTTDLETYIRHHVI